MLLNLSSIRGYDIAASDGTIGTVSDVLFDDTSWMIRWLVVDSGNLLSGRKVLLPAAALGHPDVDAQTFPVRLTKAEVEASPPLDSHRPVYRHIYTTTALGECLSAAEGHEPSPIGHPAPREGSHRARRPLFPDQRLNAS